MRNVLPHDPLDISRSSRPWLHLSADVAQCRPPLAVQRLSEHGLRQVNLVHNFLGEGIELGKFGVRGLASLRRLKARPSCFLDDGGNSLEPFENRVPRICGHSVAINLQTYVAAARQSDSRANKPRLGPKPVLMPVPDSQQVILAKC